MASGSASTPWRLTEIEESGSGTATRQLDYHHSGSGSSWAQWGDATEGGSSSGSWYAVRSIHQRSRSTESLKRKITGGASGQASSSGSNVRSASASGSADSFYDSEWEDHWWNRPETWDTGGSYRNATYDDYNYQYQWAKTWQGLGDGAVSSSASNHVTGLENGSAGYWWRHTYPFEEGTQTDEGSSFGSWNNSYDTTVTYPGFYAGAYYGIDQGGGREEYFVYLGDAFSDYPGSDSGMFPFAYSDEELLLVQAQSGTQYTLALAGRVDRGRDTQCSRPDALRESAPSPPVSRVATSRAVTTGQASPRGLGAWEGIARILGKRWTKQTCERAAATLARELLEKLKNYRPDHPKAQEIIRQLKAMGWIEERLGRGTHAGRGLILREVVNGRPTGVMLEWHPGGGHHGPAPYWKFSSGKTGTLRTVGGIVGGIVIAVIPGAAQAAEGDWNAAGRDLFVEVTPLAWAKIGWQSLCSFFDSLERDLYGEEFHRQMEQYRKEFWEKRGVRY